jgi:hypothetical protein
LLNKIANSIAHSSLYITSNMWNFLIPFISLSKRKWAKHRLWKQIKDWNQIQNLTQNISRSINEGWSDITSCVCQSAFVRSELHL